jgi:hypothetical protein
VLGKLWRSLRARGYGCGQKVHLRSSGQRRGISIPRILLEAFYAMPETHERRPLQPPFSPIRARCA